MKRTISFLIYGVWDFTTSCSFDLGIKNVVSTKLSVVSNILVSLKLPRPTSWEPKATLSLGFPYAKETLAACCGRTNLAVALSCIAFWLFQQCKTREIASENLSASVNPVGFLMGKKRETEVLSTRDKTAAFLGQLECVASVLTTLLPKVWVLWCIANPLNVLKNCSGYQSLGELTMANCLEQMALGPHQGKRMQHICGAVGSSHGCHRLMSMQVGDLLVTYVLLILLSLTYCSTVLLIYV
ncbi:hypothetical protein V6N13_069141 [Hibiscus sabdariffa]|uniref:Uncharacterized protein n=1 Tax=Hibiscus sabdariffa TaxID=183260 RepID=A0ABR2QQ20_9ROSI